MCRQHLQDLHPRRILQVLTCCLRENEFRANTKVYLQKKGQNFARVHLDQAGENSSIKFKTFCTASEVALEYSPVYASQISGAAERLVSESWTRTRLQRLGADLPEHFCPEAMHHASWLRSRHHSDLIDVKIPPTLFDLNARLNIKHMLRWGQTGFHILQPEKFPFARSVWVLHRHT